ncbi:MAG: cytochrome c oxidase subunit I [Gemmatimonadetes bacterium]|nr:cytochrome c oxidase subunit I [Gemmatimonadota bacterium]
MSAATVATAEERLERLWQTPPGLRGRFATIDHKIIGRRYLITAFVFLVLGGLEALLMRLQLARPGQALLSPEAYNQIFSMHGTTMMFLYAAPVLAGFGNVLVPLMIGARDMAFPRLNAFGYWVFLFSGIFLYSSFLFGVAPNGGWFAYVPLTGPDYSQGPNLDFYALGLLFLSISTTTGAINFIATIFKLRAPGMSLDRIPLFLWSTLTTSFAILFALPSLTVALVFLELDRKFGTAFFDPALGGSPLLWQHLFWILGHPWVYIVFLPATGIVSMVLPVFARRSMVGYGFVALATVTTGLVGFGVWVHHMFATGLPQLSLSFFSAASMTVSIPSAMQVFAWIATLRAGAPVLKTPLLFALGFVVIFVIGGLSGVMTAVIPFDWQVHDTYFVVAHLHYVLVGGNVFPVFAGLYYWLPKISGRLLDERLGRWSFWLMFLGFNVGFFPMHLSGLLGMPRRVFTYQPGLGWDTPNLISTLGALVLAGGVLVSLWNIVRSRRRGALAGADPWGANTLEWATPSPPPPYGFARIPLVRSRDPLWDDAPGAAPEEPVLAGGRETLGSTVLDAVPEQVVRFPEDSIWPLWAALALALAFVGLLLDRAALAVLGLGATALTAAVWLWPERQAGARPESGVVT